MWIKNQTNNSTINNGMIFGNGVVIENNKNKEKVEIKIINNKKVKKQTKK